MLVPSFGVGAPPSGAACHNDRRQVAVLGLLPASIATGLGSDVQRPMATVIVWGLFSSTILTLFVVPVLYRIVSPGLPKPEEPEEVPPLEPEAAQHMIT